MDDEFGEAAGARLGNKNWWRLVHGQRHGIHATLAHTGIALRGDFLGKGNRKSTSSQSQSAPSNNAVRRSFPPRDGWGCWLDASWCGRRLLGGGSGVGTAFQNLVVETGRDNTITLTDAQSFPAFRFGIQ